MRRRLADQLPAEELPGRFFVVRHADEAVCATATADTAADLQMLVTALQDAGRDLAEHGVLDGVVSEDAGPVSVGVAFRVSA